MKYGFVRTAAISPETRPGAVDYNKTEILKAIRAASEKSSEIIVAGRLGLSGYSCGNMFFYGNLLQGCIDALVFLVNETQNLGSIVVIGLPMKMANKIYDCSAIICKGRVLAFVPHDNDDSLFSGYPDGEMTYIKMDGQEVPFGKDIVLYNTELDYSVKFCDAPSYLPHAEIVLRPLATVRTMGSGTKELCFCKNYSRNNTCAILSVSSIQGACADTKIYSNEKIICELGESIEVSDSKYPNLAVSEIDITAISHTKACEKNKENVCEYNYVTVDFAFNNNDSILLREISKHPLAPKSEDDINDVINIITNGIRTKMIEAGHEKVIFGLSGGLDSAHVLMLCYHMFTKHSLPIQNIITVTMPSPHSSKRTSKNAKRLIELLGIANINVPITSAVKRHLKDLEHTEKDNVYENAQARERAQILLDLANKHNALLLGTGDLSELCLGWTTYGGDLTAHYNPNGGLTKTAIRFVIKYLAQSMYKEATKILNDVLKTPVSPELLSNQATEEILGSYELHDFFLNCLVLKGYDIPKTFFMAERAFRDKQRKDIFPVLKTFTERFFKYRFKQNFACYAPTVLNERLSDLLSDIRSGFSSEQWAKELANLKV